MKKISLRIILSLFILSLVACSTSPKAPPKTMPSPGDVVAEFPKMSLGDSWVLSDYSKKHGTAKYTYTIVSVEEDGSFDMKKENDKDSEVKINNHDSTAIGISMIQESQHDSEALQFPLFVGKSWKTEFETTSIAGDLTIYKSEFFVKEYVKIKTAIGVYDAFHIKEKVKSMRTSWRGTVDYWYAPAANAIVKSKPTHRRGVKLLEINLIE